jgi:hypothetical protein
MELFVDLEDVEKEKITSKVDLNTLTFRYGYQYPEGNGPLIIRFPLLQGHIIVENGIRNFYSDLRVRADILPIFFHRYPGFSPIKNDNYYPVEGYYRPFVVFESYKVVQNQFQIKMYVIDLEYPLNAY